jgi:hypothetical protein
MWVMMALKNLRGEESKWTAPDTINGSVSFVIIELDIVTTGL